MNTRWGVVALGLDGAGCMADVVVEKPKQNHGGFPLHSALERFVLFSGSVDSPSIQYPTLPMTEFTFAPWFLDLVLAFTLAEWLVLVLRYKLMGRGMDPINVSLGLAPGLMLMLALKLSEPTTLSLPVMAALAASGLAHALDFRRRFKG